ncbi:MAG: Crp/Fnr family transcriptional regulator [Ignavibacteria bacterium]|jgi:CRP/FNR family transcriptional regulator
MPATIKEKTEKKTSQGIMLGGKIYPPYPSSISKSPLADIIKESVEKKIYMVKKDEYLFHENKPAKGIYLVVSGRVKIIKNEKQPAQTILYLVKPGDILGIHSVINGHNTTNSAIALVNTNVCFIPGKEFQKIVKRNNQYQLIVMQLLCTRIDLVENQITSMSEKSATERLAELIVLLAETYGMNEKGILKIELGLDDLADLTGTSKGYLGKIIGDFFLKGIMDIKGTAITIFDIGNLKEIGKLTKTLEKK